MRKFVIVILLSTITVLNAKSQDTFIKEYHKYKIDTPITVSVFYRDKFYCIKSNSQMIVINPNTNLLDSSYTDNSKSIGIGNIFLRSDSLIGLNKNSTYYYDNQNNKWIFLKKGWYKPPIYEDKNYIVNSTCSGEFGGSLYFIDKTTNKKYECACTCVVSLFKEDQKYHVTASLSHLAGFTNIFEINDPAKLKPYNRDYLKRKRLKAKKKNQIYVGVIGEDESSSSVGTVQLIDSVGVITATSFVYNSKDYYLIEKNKSVSIDTISGKKLIAIDDLTNFNIWCDYPENRICGNHQVSTFNNDNNTGFIGIDKNKITFYVFEKQRK
jgi:hypothetical protein